MYFDFEDYRPDTPSVPSAISRREGILFSIIVHLLVVILMLLAPRLPFVQAAAERRAHDAEVRRLALLEERDRETPRFVFIQPRVDTPAPQAPPRAELSDQDRVARAPERAPEPTSPLPFARGNSPNRVEAAEPAAPRPAPSPPERAAAGEDSSGDSVDEPGDSEVPVVADARRAVRRAPGLGGPGAGALGEALRNLDRYIGGQESFDNPSGGGGLYDPWIQFDSKGVEFGPWIRRFVAQVKRNWFVPYAAMMMKGRVVITFHVHRDGTISELTVIGPSTVQAFNNAAYNALAASNPTQPLPPEYPSDQAFFTVTFYYNENPHAP